MNKQKLFDFASAGLPRATYKISTGKDVTIRAFSVKELKLLMLADESKTAQGTQILQVLNQCIETEGVTADNLASHDIEMLYIKLYMISKGTSLIPVKYRCNNVVDGKSCDTPIGVNVNLNNITISDAPDTTIKLSNGIVLNMKFPNIVEREYFEEYKPEKVFNLAMRCIESVTVGDETMIVGLDLSEEELSEVIEYFDDAAFGRLIDFVSSIPTISISFPLRCPKCKHEEVVSLRGLGDFFD